ncbi:asparagine synthase [Microbacterium oleivorans]|uniref:asparagine synthase n=1 Tax=Microbacterium oleivorans TaxID=273677 RepID=UPI000B0C1223|nr:asparagine synthase [Microbacterium oleivorans]
MSVTDNERVKTREVVAEGLYIASAATRLALKNRILVDILVDGDDFDSDRFLGDARDILISLAEEAEADAARTERERKAARNRYSDSSGTHDYRSRDVRNLRRRRKQSLHVAKELRARSEDQDELRKLIADARDAAWAEVSKNIDRSLRIAAARPDLDADYERMRVARMQALRLVDLPKLRAHRRSVAKQQALRDGGAEPEPILESDPAGIDPGELE